MHLKEAREKNKLEQFIKEHEKTHPVASHHHFHAVLKSMASGTVKPKRGTDQHGGVALMVHRAKGLFLRNEPICPATEAPCCERHRWPECP
jgi:hypothetical protein